jgi:hypothetical protein
MQAAMTAFPADWQIYDAEDFLTFTVANEADVDLGVLLLVQVRADGRAADHFRVVVFGSSVITTIFPVSALLGIPQAKGLQIMSEWRPAECSPRLDMASTQWTDIEEQLRAKQVALLDANNVAIDEAALTAHLNSACAKKSAIGASFRWAVADGGKMELQLQGLPLPAKFLTNEPLLRADNTATVLLASHPLNADLFDGCSHAGLVPIFFASDKGAALASITANTATTFEGNRKI